MSVYDITEFGAVSKGRICTEAIQRAIDEAERHGGGRVVVPAGEFLTGALFLKSHIELHLMMGATLLFSDRQEDYPVVASRWEGVNRDVYASCLYAEDAEQIAVTGYGMIDGNGEEWWQVFRNERDRLL